LSLHFNCGGGSGTEFYYKGERGKQLGEKLISTIEQVTGLKGRIYKGINHTLTKHAHVAGGVLEVCYCDNEQDMALYNKEKIAYAIIDVFDELATIRQTRNIKKKTEGAPTNE
jgi:N-acetylmuramoyl-L-alanine amidase